MEDGTVSRYEEEDDRVARRREGVVQVRLLTLVAGVVLGIVLTLCAVSFFFLASEDGFYRESGSLSSVTREKEEFNLEEEGDVLETKQFLQQPLQQSHIQTRAAEGAFTIVDIVEDLERSDIRLICLFFLILVIVDLLWELMTEIFHHLLHKNNPHILTIIERMYLELAVVGLVSMVLFFLVTSGKFSDHVIHVFEFCHLALFGVTALFVFTMIFVALLSIRIFKLWERLELVSVDSFEMKKALANLKGVPFYDFIHHYRRGQAKQLLHYWSLRRFFVERLDLDPAFPFDRYLKGCTKYLFSELAQVHWSTLALTVFTVLGLFYGFSAIEEYGPALIIYSAMVFFLGVLLHWKSRKIFLQMVAQRERVLVFSKILDERDERERDAEERGEVHMQMQEMEMEEMARNSSELERRAIPGGDSLSDDFLIGGEEITGNAFRDKCIKNMRRKERSVRRRKRVIDGENASYLSYSDTASSTSGESYYSSSSSCYSDEGSRTRTRGSRIDPYGEAEDEQDIDDYDEGHHLRHVHHHHHHHHHVDLDEETKLAQSDLYFILHCCIPCFTCKMNPFTSFRTWAKHIHSGHGHEALFWFRSPAFLLYLIQVMLFSQASQLILSIFACAQVFPDVHPAYLPFAMLMGLINLFHFIPMIIYHFTMVVNVGVYTKKAVVRKVGKKYRHHRRLEEENEDYDEPDYGYGSDEEEDDVKDREGLEREESPQSLKGGAEIEMEVISKAKAMENQENQRKKYHHIRRKKTKKKHEQGMVFKAHKEDDVDAFLNSRGVPQGAVDNELEECVEHPEEEIENFVKYLQSSAVLNPKKQKQKKKKKVQVRMVEMEARNSMAPPVERPPRASIDRPRASMERGRSQDRPRSQVENLAERPRASLDRQRDSNADSSNFHYHHHGL